MAILLSCPCGKQLRVNDEFAGRRVRCPECQALIAVPAVGEDNAVTAAPPSTRGAQPGGVVRFTCACGKQMQAKSEHAGKRTQCPGCGELMVIPGGNEETVDFIEKGKLSSRPASSGKRRADDEDWDEEGDRPRRRKGAPAKSKRALWPWVAGIAGVLLLVGGGLSWFFFFRGGKTSPDLALVPRDAVGFVSVRVGDWLKSDSGKEVAKTLSDVPEVAAMEKKLGMTLSDIDRVTVVFPTTNNRDAWGIISTSKPLDKEKILAELPSKIEKKVQDKTYYVSGNNAIHFFSPTIVVAGEPFAVQNFLEKKPSTSGPLSEGLSLAEDSKYHLVAGAQVPESVRQNLKALTVGGRPAMGGMGGLGNVGPFVDLKSATFTAIIGSQTQLDLRLTFPDSGTAEKVKKALDEFKAAAPFLLSLAKGKMAQGPQAAKANEILNQVEQALKTMTIEQSGSTVHIPVTLNVNLGKSASEMLVPLLKGGAVTKVREASGRAQSQNNLKQLALAMITYADSHQGQLPPASMGGGLSWRVALLPYLGQEALYRQFHLNEAWNSPHNIKLLQQMPKVFSHPSDPAVNQTMTYYQVFTGQTAPFNGTQTRRYPAEFRDGTSNTFLIVEAGVPVAWTQPADINYMPTFPLPRLGGLTPNGFNAALADGSVRFIGRNVSDQTIRAAITHAGGEILGRDW